MEQAKEDGIGPEEAEAQKAEAQKATALAGPGGVMERLAESTLGGWSRLRAVELSETTEAMERSYDWKLGAVAGRTVVEGCMAQDTILTAGPGLETPFTMPWRAINVEDREHLAALTLRGRLRSLWWKLLDWRDAKVRRAQWLLRYRRECARRSKFSRLSAGKENDGL